MVGIPFVFRNTDMRKLTEGSEIERSTLTVPEAAEILGIGRNLAYEAAQRGEIPTIKIGGRILVLREALKRLLSA